SITVNPMVLSALSDYLSCAKMNRQEQKGHALRGLFVFFITPILLVHPDLTSGCRLLRRWEQLLEQGNQSIQLRGRARVGVGVAALGVVHQAEQQAIFAVAEVTRTDQRLIRIDVTGDALEVDGHGSVQAVHLADIDGAVSVQREGLQLVVRRNLHRKSV